MEFIFLLLLLIDSTLSREADKCPKVKTQPSFDVQRYTGTWYEFSKVKESNEECVSYFVVFDDNKHIMGFNQGIDQNTGKNVTKKWYSEVTTSKAKVTFLRATFPIDEVKSFWILDTDYTSYAVLWSCTTDNQSKKYTWILTRDQKPSESILKKASQIVKPCGITEKMLKRTDQKKCPKT